MLNAKEGRMTQTVAKSNLCKPRVVVDSTPSGPPVKVSAMPTIPKRIDE
jgi:hypothetical protein